MKAFTILFLLATSLSAARILQDSSNPSSDCITNIISDVTTLGKEIQALQYAQAIATFTTLTQDIKNCTTSITSIPWIKNTNDCNGKISDIQSKADDAIAKFSIFFPSQTENDITDILKMGEDFLSSCIKVTKENCVNDVTGINGLLTKLSTEVSLTKIKEIIADAKSVQPLADDFLANCTTQSADCNTQKDSINTDLQDILANLKKIDVADCKGDVDSLIGKVSNFIDTCVNNQAEGMKIIELQQVSKFTNIRTCAADMVRLFRALKTAFNEKTAYNAEIVIADLLRAITSCSSAFSLKL